PQNDVTLKMPAFEWVHVQLHQQKGMISLSPPTICNSAMIAGLDPDEKRPKENARNIWNSYIDWGVRNPMEHKAIRRMALSERITDETRRQVKESFPELNEMCQLSVKEIFLSEAYRAFGDALFLSLAETTIEFASHDPQRAREIIALGFEAMWHALHEADAK
ncbi:hypothetical protein M2F71_16005, partial [Klebsiella pneumoniae]|nr:hypothetical protein [Klebsiella pneumoniae]